MSNDSDSSDDDRSYTSVHNLIQHIQEENEKRQPKEEAEDQRKFLGYSVTVVFGILEASHFL
jgi:hypothetical protein